MKHTKTAWIFSMFSILLCLAMLIGSTFAWFTDSAQAGVNTIQAGTLDIALLDGEGQSLEGRTLVFQKAGSNALWEPGSTWTLQDVYVKNDGNLPLKYTITITGLQGDGELNQVIDWTVQLGGQTLALTNGVSPEFSLAAGEISGNLRISGTMKTAAGNEYQGKQLTGISIRVDAAQDPA